MLGIYSSNIGHSTKYKLVRKKERAVAKPDEFFKKT